jgi:hypothetical protein
LLSFDNNWAGLEAFKQDLEHIFTIEKNAFKCNIAMAYTLYRTVYIKNDKGY